VSATRNSTACCRPAREVFEQRVLAAGERHFRSAGPHALSRDVDRDVPHFETLRRKRTPVASGQSTDAREELTEVERLGKVVVGAGIQALDARFDGVTRREHEHRDVQPGLADLAAEGQAVLPGEHDVEDRGVVVILLALLRRRGPVGGDVDRVGRFAQPLGDETGCARLIFDQQDPHTDPDLTA
jgi:hypothetical protein